MQKIIFQDLGRMGYKEAWDYQEKLFKIIHDRKVANRDLPEDQQLPTQNYLLFVEHDPVYTLGKSGDFENLLINDSELKARKIEYYKTNRGGDITFHGPGQIVGYPILDLDNFFTDIHRYMRSLEEVIIKTLAEFNIQAGRIKGLTGVWLDENDDEKARKICAMGVKCSRWITMHGWAFNINTNLDNFNNIIPCGISDKAVTSLEKELGYPLNLDDIKTILKRNFELVFEANLVEEDVAKRLHSL